MENAESILVIILSITLAIFLILSIILVSALIKLTKKVQEIAVKAGEVVDNVETATEVLKKAAGPLAIGKVLMNIVNLMSSKRKG